MTQMTRRQMAEFDAAEFEVIVRRDQAMTRLEHLTDVVHRMARDRKRGFGSSWTMTDRQAEEALRQLADGDDKRDLSAQMRPSELITKVDDYHQGIAELSAHIEGMENQYRASGGWQRYFPCLNTDGHIHATLRGCRTVQWDTSMSWATEHSGLTADEAIHGIPGEFEGLGETLCSVCFPGAPAEWCRTRSEVTRAEREAARAAKNAERDAIKAAKNLAEAFRTHDGDRITTVAAAKAVVRRPAETQVALEWSRTLEGSRRWDDQDRYAEFIARTERRLELEEADARDIGIILAARETAAPGTGWSQEDQRDARTAALKRNRRTWFK